MRNRKRLWVVSVILLLAAMVLGSCLPGQWGNWRVKEATVTDWLFSVEKRDNNIATVWLVHDDSGVYCFPDENLATYASLKEMLESGKKYEMEYTDVHLLNNSPCDGAESSSEGSGYHTYVVKSIKVAPVQ